MCSWNLKKEVNTTKSWSWIQKYVMPTKRKNTPWRHKVRHYVKKCVKTSKSVSCCQKVPWRQNVCHDINKCNIRHSAKTFVTTKMCHAINTSWCYKVRHDVNTRHDDQKFVITYKSSSWRQKVRHDVKMFVMKSKSLSWSQQHVMTWKVKNMSKFSHEVKHISWRHKVRYDIKRFVMVSKTCYDDKKFVIVSKQFIMTRHDVKSLWKRQKYVMKSKTFHEVTKCVMTSKRRHDFNKVVMMSKTYLLQKIHHDTSWRQKFVMKSKVVMKSKYVMTSMTSKTYHDVNNTPWR